MKLRRYVDWPNDPVLEAGAIREAELLVAQIKEEEAGRREFFLWLAELCMGTDPIRDAQAINNRAEV